MSAGRRIHELCNRLLAAKDQEQAREIAAELQNTIHDHIETLRDDLREGYVSLSLLQGENDQLVA